MSGKFRDKETGVVGYLRANRYIEYQIEDEQGFPINGSFKTLSELLEKWEEIEEEPKEYWHIRDGEVYRSEIGHCIKTEKRKEIGNYFVTKEEAEKAVEKLKSFKRLKDCGITFKNWTINQTGTIDCFATWGDNIPPSRKNPTLLDDLDLLFGGEDE